MNPIEATSNIIVAMINNKFINSPEDIATAFQTVYKAVRHPEEN